MCHNYGLLTSIIIIDMYRNLSKISPPPFVNKIVAKSTFLSIVSTPIYAVVRAVMLIKQEALKKQHCARGGANKWRQISFAIVYKQTHDKRRIAESLHACINRARLAACEASIFLREISQLSKISPSPSLRTHIHHPWAYFREIMVISYLL